MSAEGEQVVAAPDEGSETAPDSTEKTKADQTSESAPTENASAGSPNAEANEEPETAQVSGPDEHEVKGAEVEKPLETAESEEKCEEQKPTEEQNAEVNNVNVDTVSPPPQIVVDTVPDRDPESPTEPEAPAQSDAKAEDSAEAKMDEPQATDAAACQEKKTDDGKTEDDKNDDSKTEDGKTEDGKSETGEKDGAIATATTAESETANTTEDAASKETNASGKPDFNGKYRQVESENIEAFMQAVGMPWLMRKMATKISPSTEVRQDGDKFVIKIVTGFMTKESKFTVGEEYEDGGFGWKKELTKVTTQWDGDLLVMVSEPKNEKSKSKPVKIVRELKGDRMTMNFEVGDIVSKRVFEKKK